MFSSQRWARCEGVDVQETCMHIAYIHAYIHTCMLQIYMHSFCLRTIYFNEVSVHLTVWRCRPRSCRWGYQAETGWWWRSTRHTSDDQVSSTLQRYTGPKGMFSNHQYLSILCKVWSTRIGFTLFFCWAVWFLCVIGVHGSKVGHRKRILDHV